MEGKKRMGVISPAPRSPSHPPVSLLELAGVIEWVVATFSVQHFVFSMFSCKFSRFSVHWTEIWSQLRLRIGLSFVLRIGLRRRFN
jgi:hypothetical protein